ALKVPYTPAYNEAYLATLKDRDGVEVIEVGRSKKNRPLRVVKIGTGDPKVTPCVLIYAREHANEQDSSWAARGAIEHLLADTPGSQRLRSQFTFLIIPMLDPDGAAKGRYDSITSRFF